MSSSYDSESSILRSMVISLGIGISCLIIAFLIRTLLFIGTLDIILDLIIGVTLMTIFYMFTFIGETNWREYNRDVAGWWDVIALMIITIVLTILLFSWISTLIVFGISIVVTIYFYKKQ